LKFFVPFAAAPKLADRIYRALTKNDERLVLRHPTSRLYAITFQHRSETFRAVVGDEIAGWKYPVGPVLAIIETRDSICVHTRLQGGISATPIYASAASASARLYFDDYPAPIEPDGRGT